MTTQDLDNDSDRDYDFEDGDGALPEPIITEASGHPRKISQGTIDQYLGFVKTLRRQLLNASPDGHQRDALPIDLVDYLLSRAPVLRPKTFINYRCGLLYWLGTLPGSTDINHAKLLLQVGIPKNGYKGPKPKTTATLYSRRSSRSRTFKKRRFETLVAELSRRSAPTPDNRTNRRAMELLLWLQAGLASGLRPVEWETARWLDAGEGQLLVQTAKRKVDSYALPSLSGAPGPSTEIVERVVQIDFEDRVWVEQHLASVKRHLLQGKPFVNYYNNNRVYLWTVCKDLFPNDEKPPFRLYLMRGQFAANRKQRGFSVEEVAQQMGCAPEVASTCYGKKHNGHGGGPISDKPVMTPAPTPAPPPVAQPRKFSFGIGQKRK